MMDRETNDLIARQYLSERNLGSVEPREFSDWAVDELEKGRDSRDLRILASEFDATSFSDIERHFRASIAELGWTYPDENMATKAYAESIMQKIVDGGIEPYEGCRELYMMCIYLGYPKYLYNWNALFWAEEDLSDEELNRLITDEARRRLSGEETEATHEGFMFRGTSEQSDGFWKRLKRLLN